MPAKKKPENSPVRKPITMADISILVLLLSPHLPGFLFYGFGLRVGGIIALVQTVLVCALLFVQYTISGKVSVRALRRNRWILVWLFVGIYVGAIGLTRNNEFIGWVCSDLYRYFVVVIIVGLILCAEKSFNLERIVKLSAGYEIVIALIEVLAILSGRYARTSNMMHILFPYAFAMLLLERRRTLIFWRVGFAIELTRIVLSQSRTLLLEVIGFIILIPLLVLEYRRRGVIRHIVELFILFLVLMLSVQFLVPSLTPLEKYRNRLTRLINVESDISITGRFLEAQAALAYLYNQGIVAMLVGTGAGSTYYFPEIMLSAGSEKYLTTSFQVHNIHIGPVSVLFRTGIIGLILIYMPLVFILLHLMVKAPQPMTKVVVAFMLFKVIESIQALRLVGDPFLLLMLATANYEVYLCGLQRRAAMGYKQAQQVILYQTTNDSSERV